VCVSEKCEAPRTWLCLWYYQLAELVIAFTAHILCKQIQSDFMTLYQFKKKTVIIYKKRQTTP